MSKKIIKYLLTGILVVSAVFVSLFSLWKIKKQSFEMLSPEKKHEMIISLRAEAIEEAKERGDYRCCINPPCTMCYDRANKWNNYQAGTCACDNLIAEGKEPCPQCKSELCEKEAEKADRCKIDIDNE